MNYYEFENAKRMNQKEARSLLKALNIEHELKDVINIMEEVVEFIRIKTAFYNYFSPKYKNYSRHLPTKIDGVERCRKAMFFVDTFERIKNDVRGIEKLQGLEGLESTFRILVEHFNPLEEQKTFLKETSTVLIELIEKKNVQQLNDDLNGLKYLFNKGRRKQQREEERAEQLRLKEIEFFKTFTIPKTMIIECCLNYDDELDGRD